MPSPLLVRAKAAASMQVRRRVANLPVRLPLSAHGEEAVIGRWLDRLGDLERVCVDIAASDGVDQSNTFSLFDAGWTGLALEADPARFRALAAVHARRPGVGLARTFVTPGNVRDLLRGFGIPRDFGFLSFDIDGYDHYVLDALLQEWRPALMCVEINEKIPPPLRFTIRPDAGFEYRGDHFFGQSISKLVEMTAAHGYDLVELHYNNALLVPVERGLGVSLTAEDAYRTGYAERPDRAARFAYNADMDPLLTMTPEDAARFVREKFRGREAEYLLEL
jgi:hypothetical protein